MRYGDDLKISKDLGLVSDLVRSLVNSKLRSKKEF